MAMLVQVLGWDRGFLYYLGTWQFGSAAKWRTVSRTTHRFLE